MMPIDMNKAIQQIRNAGTKSVRSVPMLNESIDGNYQIEINQNGTWAIIVTGVKKDMAEDIIRQATNRVLLG